MAAKPKSRPVKRRPAKREVASAEPALADHLPPPPLPARRNWLRRLFGK